MFLYFFSQTPVNVNIEESDLLKDVRYRRHRQELMFRIAHVNKEKTKLLFQALGPPYYVDTKTQEGLRRYYPHVMVSHPLLHFPSLPFTSLHFYYNYILISIHYFTYLSL